MKPVGVTSNTYKLITKELQITNQKEFRVEEVIKIKSDKLYVKQKGYDFVNNWIDNKYIV